MTIGVNNAGTHDDAATASPSRNCRHFFGASLKYTASSRSVESTVVPYDTGSPMNDAVNCQLRPVLSVVALSTSIGTFDSRTQLPDLGENASSYRPFRSRGTMNASFSQRSEFPS